MKIKENEPKMLFIITVHIYVILGLFEQNDEVILHFLQDVDTYWCEMWTICINTLLGGRLVVHGKDILLEDLSKKAAMIEAVAARSPKEVMERDTGAIPGDRKGAAGIDSAFFAHLKRNWHQCSHNNSIHQVKK